MDTQAGHDAIIASISSAFRDIKERINALEQQVNCLVCNEVETISSFDETFVITAARRVGGLAQSNTRNVVDQNSNGKPELIRNTTTSKDFSAAGSKKNLKLISVSSSQTLLESEGSQHGKQLVLSKMKLQMFRNTLQKKKDPRIHV